MHLLIPVFDCAHVGGVMGVVLAATDGPSEAPRTPKHCVLCMNERKDRGSSPPLKDGHNIFPEGHLVGILFCCSRNLRCVVACGITLSV